MQISMLIECYLNDLLTKYLASVAIRGATTQIVSIVVAPVIKWMIFFARSSLSVVCSDKSIGTSNLNPGIISESSKEIKKRRRKEKRNKLMGWNDSLVIVQIMPSASFFSNLESWTNHDTMTTVKPIKLGV